MDIPPDPFPVVIPIAIKLQLLRSHIGQRWLLKDKALVLLQSPPNLPFQTPFTLLLQLLVNPSTKPDDSAARNSQSLP